MISLRGSLYETSFNGELKLPYAFAGGILCRTELDDAYPEVLARRGLTF
jgi:hypothetical protein